jgi:hypothetical protein
MESDLGAGTASEQAQLTNQATADQGSDQSASAGDGSAATTEGAAAKPSWKDIDFSQVDPHELIKSVPALQGVIGNLTQKQAQQLARQMAQEESARQEAANAAARMKADREEKRRLAKEDPDALAARVLEEVSTQDYNEWQSELRRSMQSEFTGYIAGEVQAVYDDPDVQEIMQGADRETLAKLDWRSHNGLASWVKVVNGLVADHKAEKKAESLLKARSKASDKEQVVDGARADAGDGVDLGLAGSIPGGRLFTKADLATMTLAEYRKYKQIIAVQDREGRIR